MADTEKKPKPSDAVAFIASSRKRFQRCIDATVNNRPYQLDDVRFAAGSPDNGWQWPEDVLNARMKTTGQGSRPTLTVNKLPQHIKLVTNEQRRNRPQGKVLPVDDKGDPEVAEILNGIIRHIDVSSHADIAYDNACECQVTSGEGYWRILTDYCDEKSFDQDIRVALLRNPFSVYMDPDGLKKDSTGRECQYGFITDRMTTDAYEAAFPKAKGKVDWDNLGIGDNTFNWFDDEGVTIAEYFYYDTRKATLVRWSDGSVTVDDEMPKVAALTVTATRDTQLRSVKWCKINGLEVLEESEWAGKYIPIVRVVGNEWDVEGQMVVSGLVRNAKDPQRMVNYWTSQEAEMLALAPKAPFMVTPEQVEGFEDMYRDANIVNYAYLTYNNVASSSGAPLPPPQRVQPPMPSMGIIEAKRGSADDLQATVGQYNPSLGADAKEKSGRAIQARQQQADVGTFHYIDNLSRSIGYSTEIVLDLIPKIYDTERVARIIGEDGEPDHCTLCVGKGQAVTETQGPDGAIQKIYDPSVGKYDVVVTTGPSFTTKRLESAEFLTAAAQAAKDPVTSQIISYLALKSQDWPGANEAAQMIKKTLPPGIVEAKEGDQDPEAMMMQVQQAAQQVEEKSQMLAQAHEEMTQLAKDSQAQQKAAQDAENRAKEAGRQVQASIDQLEALQKSIENERQLLDMQKRLAEKELQISRTTLQSEKDVLEADVKVLTANLEKKIAEVTNAGEAVEKDERRNQETEGLVNELRGMIAEVTRIASAERELIMDDQGEPVGSRLRLAA